MLVLELAIIINHQVYSYQAIIIVQSELRICKAPDTEHTCGLSKYNIQYSITVHQIPK